MGACPQPSCPHHEAIDRDVQRHQKWIGDVEGKLELHCSNGGTGHVTSKSIGGISSPAIDELSAVMKALADVIAELA